MPRTIAVLVLSLLALPLLAADADLAASLSLSRPPFAGTAFNVQLDIRNQGPGTASDVRATLRIPADRGFDYQIDRCTLTADLLDCRVGDLAAGGTTRILAGVYTPKDPITITASVAAASNELNAADNSATYLVTPINMPDLVPSIRVDPALVANRSSRLLLTVENRGAGSTNDVVAHWTIDAEVTSMGSFCTRSTVAAKTWDCKAFSAIPSGGSNDFTAFLAPLPAGSSLTSSATVTSATADYDESNNATTFFAAVATDAQLAIKATAAGTLDGNGRLFHRYTVENTSGTDAHNVGATLQLFDGSTFVSSEGADCAIVRDSSDARAACRLPDVPAHQSITFTFLTKPPRPAGHFSSIANVTWGDPILKLSVFGSASTIVYRDVLVTNTDDAGPGSLRAAILEVNRTCLSFETPCRIAFALPGPPPQPSGWFTIAPSPLPVVTAYEVSLDGESQTAFTGDTNPRGPEIELHGTHDVPANGLVLQSNFGTVRGLAINGFAGNGILGLRPTAASYPQFTIERNDLGTDPSGEVVIPNTDRGVRIMDGTAMVRGNLIRGNGRSGVFFDHAVGSMLDNRILDNGASGIFIGDESGSSLAVKEIRGNVIAGNRDFGIAATSARNVAVRENSIHDNGGLSFDVGLDGPTAVPPLPGNSFSLVQRPFVTSALYDAAANETVISMRTDDPPPYGNTIYTFYLFATPRLNRAGFAEAETFLTKVRLERGSRAAEVRVPGDLRGQYITALAERYVYFGDGQVTGRSELSLGLLLP
jgi:hypothetical protein